MSSCAISVTVPSAGFAKGSHATGCFRYDLGGIDSVRPHEVECPDKPALVLPEPTPEPTLPPDSQDRLRRALSAADPAAALTRVFQGTRAVVGTAVTGGIVGAAVLAGRDECLFGRRLADKTIEIWVVPRVLAQPGELGCGAEFAAAGDGKTPPH